MRLGMLGRDTGTVCDRILWRWRDVCTSLKKESQLGTGVSCDCEFQSHAPHLPTTNACGEEKAHQGQHTTKGKNTHTKKLPLCKHKQNVTETLYKQLSSIIQETPSTERLMILGDFNARVGGNSSAWPDILGDHGHGNMNDNGQRLLDLCSTHKLCIPSSFFQGSSSSKVTWCHPRSKRWHQLDHVLVKRKHLK
ncbi:Craniofacial development protein 2 [Merluccius polli]|uniref:Craniofacial development protein 2 n=1 Tax=Merluccius polli TaxID=89951 RepID=A0AA47MAP7_MERPO|nr:Craniofacial development protein 2 [Merluccius polli]